jgi:proteasome lid subunit RPN8/RPN11
MSVEMQPVSRVVIAAAVARAIQDHAAAEQPREACGLLFGAVEAGRLTIEAMAPAANVSSAPRTRFEVAPAALCAAQRRGRAGPERWLGHWHSHPTGSAVPSAADADAITDPDHLWLIVAGEAMRAWVPCRGGFRELPLAMAAGAAG